MKTITTVCCSDRRLLLGFQQALQYTKAAVIQPATWNNMLACFELVFEDQEEGISEKRLCLTESELNGVYDITYGPTSVETESF